MRYRDEPNSTTLDDAKAYAAAFEPSCEIIRDREGGSQKIGMFIQFGQDLECKIGAREFRRILS